jgi:hypothetical protein
MPPAVTGTVTRHSGAGQVTDMRVRVLARNTAAVHCDSNTVCVAGGWGVSGVCIAGPSGNGVSRVNTAVAQQIW